MRRYLIKRRTRDGLAVVAFGSFIVACTYSIWAMSAAVFFALLAAAIDPESTSARAREHRRQRRAEHMRQQGLIPVQARRRDCGCFDVPAQTVHCPADAALAEIEHMAEGHG